MATDDTSQVADTSTAQDMDASAQEPIQEQTEDTTESVEPVSESEVDSSEVKSERGQKRVDELARERNQFEQENRTLKEQLAQQTTVIPETDYLKEIENFDLPLTGDYATDMQLIEQRAVDKAISEVEKRNGRRESIRDDVRELERAYPELRNDETNSTYDPELSHEIVTLYREASSRNPDLRLKPFVDRVMKLRTKAVSAGKEQSVAQIMAQEQSSVVTPSSKSQITSKQPNDMSLNELEKMVGYAAE